MKRTILLLFVVFSYNLLAQVPVAKWVKNIPFEIISQATDDKDNIFIAGAFQDTMQFENHTLISAPSIECPRRDIIIAKYDSSGNMMWYKQFGAWDDDIIADLKVDHNNDVILTITYNSATIIDGDTIITQYNNHNAILAKFSNDGELIWYEHPGFNPAGCLHVFNSAIDNENNIIISSNISSGLAEFPGDSISCGDFISKYNSNGEFQWVKCADNLIRQMVCDNSNNIIIAIDAFSNTDLIKYSPEGDTLWSKHLNICTSVPDNQNFWPRLVADKYNNIYLTGSFTDTINIDGSVFIGNSYASSILLKLDASGHLIWGKTLRGRLGAVPISLAIKDNKVFLVGDFFLKLYYNNDSLVSSTATGFMAGYDYAGNLNFIRKITSFGSCRSQIITEGKSIYYSGYVYSDSIFFDNCLLISEFSPTNPKSFFLVRYPNEVNHPEKIVDDFLIYPNPTKGMVSFDFNPAYGEVALELYDIRGALVKTYTLNQTHNDLNLGFLAQGLYIVKLISGLKVQTVRFEKM